MNTVAPEEISNSTNLSNVTYQYPFDSVGIAISAIIIFTFMLFGLLGNSLTMAVIYKYKALNSNVFMRFILSLCVSDLISALISWLFLYRRTWGFDRWSPIPDVFCTFYWAADLMTSFVTALHILSFAVLRLISIKFPIAFNKINMKKGNMWISTIWVVCFLCGFLPACFIFYPGTPQRNSDNRNARWPACTVRVDRIDVYSAFQWIAYSIFLIVPIFGVTIICGIVIYLFRKRSKKNFASRQNERLHQKEKQAVFQLILIIVAFLVGYVPFIAYELWGVQEFPNENFYQRTDYWFGMVEYFFLRFSECLNPIFYNLGSRKLRKYTIKFIAKYIPGGEKLKSRFFASSTETCTTTNFTTNAQFGV